MSKLLVGTGVDESTIDGYVMDTIVRSVLDFDPVESERFSVSNDYANSLRDKKLLPNQIGGTAPVLIAGDKTLTMYLFTQRGEHEND